VEQRQHAEHCDVRVPGVTVVCAVIA
jgi:hypothetical protein